MSLFAFDKNTSAFEILWILIIKYEDKANHQLVQFLNFFY